MINKSARLKKTFELIEEIKLRGEKVLIFILSRKMQIILKEMIERKYEIEIMPPINGMMSGGTRQEIVNEFNEKKGFNILILSPEAAGVGFTKNTKTMKLEEVSYWNIEEVDKVTGEVFESIIEEIYKAKGYESRKTPLTNDYGVDVIALDKEEKRGYLIQCKHREDVNKKVGIRAIQEIYSAVNHYGKGYEEYKLEPIVITNAKGFTREAIELARNNRVKLISREELEEMINSYKVIK